MNTSSLPPLSSKVFNATVVIAGLGYLIDMFDFLLYNMVRVASLQDLGLSGDALTDAGIVILNCQAVGVILGACFWGILADRKGRKLALLFSIAFYSIGSLLSAAVFNVESYALARFITGFGIAGELGGGVALILEKLNAEKRGSGAMIFISFGYIGVFLAALIVELVEWRYAYIIGGVVGLLLLLTRAMLKESWLYQEAAKTNVIRGGFKLITSNPLHFKRYIGAIFLMSSAVFAPQILWTLSPEIGRGMNLPEPVKANIVLGIGFGCFILANILASWLSDKLRSRKKAVLILWILQILVFALYANWPVQSLTEFYILNGFMALTGGIWVITAAWIAEHFGTNIRGTVATTVPNFARGMAVPMNLAYKELKIVDPVFAISVIGTVIFSLAIIGWSWLKETYGKDLNYVEHK
ncbi:MAG: MFS transporter [Dongiaceae bacterium]